MTTPATNSGISPEIAHAAIEWLLALQHDAGQARPGLQAWLAAHPEHRRAWQRIEAVNGQLRDAAHPVGAAMTHAMLAPPRSPRRRGAVKTLAVAVFAGSGAWLLQDQLPWRHWRADLRTAVGERRDVTLADGTRVQLNTDSALALQMTAPQRSVSLLAGEVLLSVASEALPARRQRHPLVLHTPHGSMAAHGMQYATRFCVRLAGALSRLDVFDGAVEITTAGSGQQRVLQAGQRASFGQQAIGDTLAAREADSAWSDGMLVANGMALADFLAELSRYRRGHLGCDAAVAQLRVSGTFHLADPEAVIHALLASPPLQARYLTRYWLTIEPRAI